MTVQGDLKMLTHSAAATLRPPAAEDHLLGPVNLELEAAELQLLLLARAHSIVELCEFGVCESRLGFKITKL